MTRTPGVVFETLDWCARGPEIAPWHQHFLSFPHKFFRTGISSTTPSRRVKLRTSWIDEWVSWVVCWKRDIIFKISYLERHVVLLTISCSGILRKYICPRLGKNCSEPQHRDCCSSSCSMLARWGQYTDFVTHTWIDLPEGCLWWMFLFWAYRLKGIEQMPTFGPR